MRTYAEAVAYAEKQRTNPSRDWTLLCQMFARSCVGASVWAGSAFAAWHKIPEQHRHGGRPRAGSLAYFDYPDREGEFGHVVFVVEGGMCYSNDILRKGKIDKVPLRYITERWGMRYLGWITWTPSGAINLKPYNLEGGNVHIGALRFGRQGSLSVMRMQDRLNELDTRDVFPTGNYDDATDAAVRRFQRRLGDRPDPAGESSLGPKQAARLFPQPPYKLIQPR